MTIDNSRYAFGIDISRYDSADGLPQDFTVVAKHDPQVTFIASRSSISWGYQDPWFPRNWKETRAVDDYRKAAGIEAYPVGRLAYHVLYPGESPQAQADNLFRTIGDMADWQHDRIVIDLELHHNQSRRTITNAAKEFAYACKYRTSSYPILYCRRIWLQDYTYPAELSFMDLWLAQYRYAYPFPLYTPEYTPPPQIPNGFNSWIMHQTGDKGKPIGVDRKHYMDYDRFNGGAEAVAKYFGYDSITQPEPPQIPVVTPPDALDRLWAAHEELHD